MFRTGIFMALIAMAYLVHSSDAVNCTSTSFKQELSAAQLAASKLIAAEYANSTKEQIVAKLKEMFNETATFIDCNVTRDGDAVRIDYKIIFACNETTTTVLPDGTSRTTERASRVNRTRVEKAISAGQSILFVSL